jgi:protein-disulfide isomerase
MKFHIPAVARSMAVAGTMLLLVSGSVHADDVAAPASSSPMSTMAAPSGTSTSAAGGLTDEQRREVEATIRNYLIANPEIVRDAINALQAKEDAAAQVAQQDAIKQNAGPLFNAKREAVIGNPKGDVTLVEFFDFNCPYCRHAEADMKTLVADDPNLRVVLKQFPILGDASVAAAQIAVAVLLTAPDKYAAFHDELISDKGQADGSKALAVAQELGLDPAKIKAMANSSEVKANISAATDLAQKLDITGTPSYATKLKVVVGAVGLDALKAEIKAVRDCNKVASC